MEKQPEIIAEFDKCPVCHSTRRYAEFIAAEQKEKGLMGQDMMVWGMGISGTTY